MMTAEIGKIIVRARQNEYRAVVLQLKSIGDFSYAPPEQLMARSNKLPLLCVFVLGRGRFFFLFYFKEKGGGGSLLQFIV